MLVAAGVAGEVALVVVDALSAGDAGVALYEDQYVYKKYMRGEATPTLAFLSRQL